MCIAKMRLEGSVRTRVDEFSSAPGLQLNIRHPSCLLHYFDHWLTPYDRTGVITANTRVQHTTSNKQEGLAVASIAQDDPSPLPVMHRDHNAR